MHKFPMPIAHDVGPARRGAKLARALALVTLGLLLAPLVAEGTSYCLAQWREVLGENSEAKTPILDSIADSAEESHKSVEEFFDLYFHRLPWDPRIVFAVGAIIVVLGMKMLRV
jgi:hypothetical protein